jgi:hypothetical protein
MQPTKRAGAIDSQVTFPLDICEYRLSAPAGNRNNQPRHFYHGNSLTAAQLSVQEREPLYCSQDTRMNVASPIPAISSLNGLRLPQTLDAYCDNVLLAYRNSTSAQDHVQACLAVRRAVFSHIQFAGFSIAVYDAGNTQQSNYYSVTHGGLITVQAQGNFHVGELAAIDLPYDSSWMPIEWKCTTDTPCGLFRDSRQPFDKKTLLVVSVHEDLYDSFYSMGQIVGRCVRGNKSQRGDIEISLGAAAHN